MAHFALLNEKNIVINIIKVDNNSILDSDGKENENLGITFCNSLVPGKWIQCSWNSTFRNKFPCINTTIYDSELDAFIDVQPYPSWIFNKEKLLWESPILNKYEQYVKKYNFIGAFAYWDESEKKWYFYGPKIYSKDDILKLETITNKRNKMKREAGEKEDHPIDFSIILNDDICVYPGD
jgi:hypothetical protein